MKVPLTVLKKRCERCEKLYDLPRVQKSRAKEILIQFFPCSHCGFAKEQEKSEQSGRCKDCSIPFFIINHHYKGNCNRCYMTKYRKKLQK